MTAATKGRPKVHGLGSLREHFRYDGTPKAALTECEAKSIARGTEANSYRCGLCGAWHVGGRAA
jgi:hypothetical protein